MWQTKKSKHYIFNYFPDSLAEKEIDQIVTNQEKIHSEILDFLSIKNDRVINYFLYPDNKTKGKLMGDEGNGNTNWEKHEVHAVYNEKIKCIGAHEDTHLLSLPLGTSVKLFREGLAEYLSKTWHDKPQDYWAKKFLSEGEKIDFSEILDPGKWDDDKDLVLYPCSGSFCGFLVKELGKEKFLELYGFLDRTKPVEYNLKQVESATGKTISNWQSLWEKYVLN